MDVVKHNTKEADLSLTKRKDIADLFESHLNAQLSDRTKTSLRIHYEAQAEVIKRQIGNLEEIRLKIGLSQRKICQLLLVDPSAWSRWTKSESAPPHIFRALQWYLIIQEKIPGLTPQYFVGKDPQVLHQEALRKISEEAQKRSEVMENFLSQSIKLEEEVEELKSLNETLQAKQVQILKRVEYLKRIIAVIVALFLLSLYFSL